MSQGRRERLQVVALGERDAVVMFTPKKDKETSEAQEKRES